MWRITPLFQRMALPIVSGRTRVPGIKIHDTRMIRLMEVLQHSGTKIGGWRMAEIHEAILSAFGLKTKGYSITQLRYDLRKMKAHGLVERDGTRYAYRLTAKGNKAALLFVLSHKASAARLPTAYSTRPRSRKSRPATKIEAAYRKADHSIDLNRR